MGSTLAQYVFEGSEVRVVLDERGEPWWVAKDVAEVLGYVWNGTARVAHVPEEWRGVTSVVTPSGTQEMVTLSEQGLYFFLGRSDKPRALPMQRWVAGQVLPAIRKTGAYTVPAAQPLPEVAALVAMSKAELLRMAADLAEQVEQKQRLLEAQAPKVGAYERFMDASGALSLRDTAKVLGLKEKDFIHKLLEDGILYRTPGEGGRLRAYAHQEEAGRFIHRAGAAETSGKAYTQVRVTPKGLAWLGERYTPAEAEPQAGGEA